MPKPVRVGAGGQPACPDLLRLVPGILDELPVYTGPVVDGVKLSREGLCLLTGGHRLRIQLARLTIRADIACRHAPTIGPCADNRQGQSPEGPAAGARARGPWAAGYHGGRVPSWTPPGPVDGSGIARGTTRQAWAGRYRRRWKTPKPCSARRLAGSARAARRTGRAGPSGSRRGPVSIWMSRWWPGSCTRRRRGYGVPRGLS